jgi:hypothetical protein
MGCFPHTNPNGWIELGRQNSPAVSESVTSKQVSITLQGRGAGPGGGRVCGKHRGRDKARPSTARLPGAEDAGFPEIIRGEKTP